MKSRFDEVGRENGRLMLRWLIPIGDKQAEGNDDPSTQRTGERLVTVTCSSCADWHFKTKPPKAKACCYEMKREVFIIYWWYIYKIYICIDDLYCIYSTSFLSLHLYKLEHFSMHCSWISTFLWLRKILHAHVWKVVKLKFLITNSCCFSWFTAQFRAVSSFLFFLYLKNTIVWHIRPHLQQTLT